MNQPIDRDVDGQFIDLDHNATTRPLPEVAETVAFHLRQSYANPGSRHAAGRQARHVLETSRESIADILGADPDEVIFTSGGTESINTAITGLLSGKPGKIALTKGEHAATVETVHRLAQQGHEPTWLTVDAGGLLEPGSYEQLAWNEVKLVTVILAHNETGVIQHVDALAQLCRKHAVPLHLDAVQAIGKIPFHFHQANATAVSLAAHKFHGPRGVGALLLRRGTRLIPHLFGGHQEADRRPGTEPVALIAGMAKALELWRDEWELRMRNVAAMRDQLERELAQHCPPVVINGNREQRLFNTANLAFPGIGGEALLVALDLEGVGCSLGSACASGSAEPAPVLMAMGCPPEVYRSSIRFSLGIDNRSEEIAAAVQRISGVVNRLRSSSAGTDA